MVKKIEKEDKTEESLPEELIQLPKTWKEDARQMIRKANGFVNNMSNLAYKASSLLATLLMSKSNPVAAGMAVIAVVPEVLSFFESDDELGVSAFDLAVEGFEEDDSGVVNILHELEILETLDRKIRWKNDSKTHCLISVSIDNETVFIYRGAKTGEPNHTRIWVKEGLVLSQIISKIMEKKFEAPCTQLSMAKNAVNLKPVLFNGVYEGKHDPVKFANTVEKFRRKGLDYSVILHGPPGTGKCLGKGTPVIKYDGTIIAVEDIKDGDVLMGPDSKPRIVRGTTKGTGPLFKIIPTKGAEWVCNDVHVLTLKNTDTKEITDISLDQFLGLSKSKQVRQKLFKVGVDFPQREKSPIDPYFLGVWFGNGTKECGKYGLKVIQVTKPDAEIENICAQTAKDWRLSMRTRSSKKGVKYYTIVGKKGAGHKNALTLKMRKLLGPSLTIPDCIKYGSRETRLQFLAGIVDTDGFLDNNSFEVAQKRADWAQDVMFIARSLGLCVTTRIKTVNGTEYTRLNISGHTDMIPTRIPRKQAKPRKQIKDVLNTGFEVEPIGEGDYYGFCLDGDGRFLLGDFTVTHNTTFIMSYAELRRHRVLIIGPEIISNGIDISLYIDVLKPDILLLDDYDRSESYSFAYTTLPAIKSRMPNMLVCITCNFPQRLGSAILRPGRGGHMIEFDAPDDADRKIVFEKYMEFYEIPNPEDFDYEEILAEITEDWTHDWIRHLAKMCLVFNTQEEIMEFIQITNKQIKWVGNDMKDDDEEDDDDE